MSRSVKAKDDGGKGLKKHYRCDKLKMITSPLQNAEMCTAVLAAARILFLPLLLHVASL